MVVEDGSELVAELWATRHRAASNVVSYPEARAALAAARRAGRLSAKGHGRAVEELDSLQSELLLIGIDRSLAGEAGRLADEHGLRGYDAVHLASALAPQPASATTMISWDRDLRRAAARCGCAVAPAS